MASPPEVESKHAPPLVECPNCDHMLPQGMGEVECDICGAVCRVSHEPTMETLKGESVQCPHCATVVVAGTEKRPVELTCASCSGIFVITRKIVKVEIGCPGCQSQLRIRPRPGKRELRCPSCSNSFNVTF
ncbi:MAG: hypothetical protein QF545_01415 [Candidatus Thalassarchaeaceae archaeon]|nr:hypothetical protein [Candidatus Thalassarchaeaceae archaeon]MDP7003554.1 hypothetical protein [Candidatus Thalassarchaeaceae archaeon]